MFLTHTHTAVGSCFGLKWRPVTVVPAGAVVRKAPVWTNKSKTKHFPQLFSESAGLCLPPSSVPGKMVNTENRWSWSLEPSAGSSSRRKSRTGMASTVEAKVMKPTPLLEQMSSFVLNMRARLLPRQERPSQWMIYKPAAVFYRWMTWRQMEESMILVNVAIKACYLG